MPDEKQQQRDRDLLRIIAAGAGRKRDHAVTELFRSYAPLFSRYFRRQGAQSSEADDLVQETFVKIVRGAGSYRGEASASAWMWSIAKNTLLSAYRSSARRSAEQLGMDLDSVMGQMNDSAESKQLRDCVRNEFSVFAKAYPDRAEALALTVYHGWKPKDIAVFLDRTAAATREYLSQCRKILKGYLEKCREYLEP